MTIKGKTKVRAKRDKSYLVNAELPVELWEEIKVQAERETEKQGFKVSGRALLLKYLREGLRGSQKTLDRLSKEA